MSSIFRHSIESYTYKYLIILIFSTLSTVYFVFQVPSAVYLFLLNLLTLYIVFIGVTVERDNSSISFWKLLFMVCFIYNLWRAGFALVFPETAENHPHIPRVWLGDQLYGGVVFFVGIFFTLIGYLLANTLTRKKGSLTTNESKRYRNIHRALTNKTGLKIAYVVTVIALFFAMVYSNSAEMLSQKRVFTTASGVETRFGPIRFALGAAYLYLLSVFYYKYFSGETLKKLLLPCGILALVGVVISLRIFILLPFLPFIFDNFHKVKPKRFLLFLVFIAVFILAISYTTGMRITGGNYRIVTISTSVVEAIGHITTNLNFGGYLPTGMSTSLVSRVAPVMYGETLFVNPVRQFVPRALYPSKPEELGGELREMLKEIGFFPSWMQGGVPPGAYAEFWLNFRWYGVVLCSTLLGVYAYSLNRSKRAVQSKAIQAYYSTLIILLITFFIGGIFSRYVLMWVQINIVLYAVLVYLSLYRQTHGTSR